jgi:hypothetical protein
MNTLHNRQFPLGIIHNDDKLIVITSQGTHYATTYDPAAARLISAAPDLLSALERLLKISQEELDQSATHDGLVNCEALANARAAIAKAKGAA